MFCLTKSTTCCCVLPLYLIDQTINLLITNRNHKNILINQNKLLPKWWSSTENFRFMPWISFHFNTSEKWMLFDAFFPKIFTFISTIKNKFNDITKVFLKIYLNLKYVWNLNHLPLDVILLKIFFVWNLIF